MGLVKQHKRKTMKRKSRKGRKGSRSHTRRSRTYRARSSYRARGGFRPFPSESFGPDMVDSEEAGGAVVVKNVSGVPTVMSAERYRRDYRGDDVESL